MRIQVLQVVNAVSLHGWFSTLWRWQEPPKQQEPLTVTRHHIPEHSDSHYVTCCEHIGICFQKNGINLLKKVPQQHSSLIIMSGSLNIAQECAFWPLVSFTVMNASIINSDIQCWI